MALDFKLHGIFDGAQRVHVLGLGARAELFLAVGAQGNVGVATDVAAFHLGVGHAKVLHDFADGRNIGLGQFGGTGADIFDRLGDNFNQRNTRAVVVHKGEVGALDAAGGATHVGQLSGVFLHVGALDLHMENRAVFELNVDPAVVADGVFVLGRLEVLGCVRVEVLLPGKGAVLGDLAVQRQADQDRGLHGLLVHDRQHAGQAQAHLIDVGVGLVAKDVRGRGEHLGLGVQLNMDLEAEHRIVLFHGFVEAENGVNAH